MKEQILQLFNEYPHLAIIISLLVSILIAILGVVPSVFITAANLLFFGFWKGTCISFLGEALGAAVAFYLYRKGFKNAAKETLHKYPKVERLLNSSGSEAFKLIFTLRLLPFVPSGLVTFAAAIGTVSISTFFIASSLGKLPALLLEAYSVYQVSKFEWQGKLILAIVAVSILFFLVKRMKK